ncbi:hypothetical protein AAFF_G00088260 [Aldrovandia affinis]|uniref:Uncharacterized protein n=1 Tax=Aldrovandia affinis TaxID=143900 RepID=A0AAD7RWC6_9TELE|nr:hypothetical protein AAFF_G00088260 [Aldrovandia affinis]
MGASFLPCEGESGALRFTLRAPVPKPHWFTARSSLNKHVSVIALDSPPWIRRGFRRSQQPKTSSNRSGLWEFLF